jgi:hypothetical protein
MVTYVSASGDFVRGILINGLCLTLSGSSAVGAEQLRIQTAINRGLVAEFPSCQVIAFRREVTLIVDLRPIIGVNGSTCRVL